MANIKLNGKTDIENMTCLSYAPTVFEVSSVSTGSYTMFNFSFGDFSNLDYTTTYTVQVNDIILTAVTTPSEANGYRFYLDNAYTAQERKSMVNSLLMALRRIPSIVAGYTVSQPTSNGEKQLSISMISRGHGNNTPLEISTNIPFLTITTQKGTANTELKEGNVNIDLYKLTTTYKYNSTSSDVGEYITTLSKHVSNDSKVRFDLGSVFSSLTDEGNAAQFRLSVYLTNENGLIEVGEYKNIYNVNGYLINQGGEYLPKFDDIRIAMNARRGENRDYLNNTILYVYEDTIPLSVYASDKTNSFTYTVRYIGSDNTPITSFSVTTSLTDALNHLNITLSKTTMQKSKYIDIVLPNNHGTLRYNVIKPVRMTDECHRLYWYNSWGGVSFFDFTGNKTEERKVTNTTYQESILNYYDDNYNEKAFIYDKKNEISVKLSTHNILKDAQWHLFDLQQSRSVWTYINGEKCRVLVDDLTINETNVSDVYTATISYTYSMGVNL